MLVAQLLPHRHIPRNCPDEMIKGYSQQHRRTRSVIRAPSRRLLLRLLLVFTFVGFLRFLDLHMRYRDALRAKYLPTEFLDFRDGQSNATQRLYSYIHGDAPSKGRAEILSNRQQWKRLGGGYEGEAFAYGGSVVKVYNERSSPFRNCVPTKNTSLRWPTEIPATMIMGGPRRNLTSEPGTSPEEAFIPVEDFFRAPAAPGGKDQWHLVTPFLRAGTLKKLAAATSSTAISYLDVDRVYRPSFEFLLSGLDYLHNQHNLCHDDIKQDNIFVASPEHPTQWVLADLGNARQPDHPYHASLLWTADTPQHPDCKLNDVIRLTKSYLAFVRSASSDASQFDATFFDVRGPLAALYWGVVQNPAPAVEVHARSIIGRPLSDRRVAPGLGGTGPRAGVALSLASIFVGRKRALAIAVSRHLRIGASEMWGKIFGLSWLVGVPVSGCSGAA